MAWLTIRTEPGDGFCYTGCRREVLGVHQWQLKESGRRLESYRRVFRECDKYIDRTIGINGMALVTKVHIDYRYGAERGGRVAEQF